LKPKNVMSYIEKINLLLNRALLFIGGVFLVGMIVLCCANIFLRIGWTPIRGTFELMGFFGAIVTAFALSHTQNKRAHISVNVLIDTFSSRTRHILRIINDFICLIFFLIVAWQMAVKAGILMQAGEVTETLRIIYYPFTYAAAFGCLILAMTFLTDILKALFACDYSQNRGEVCK